MPCPGKIYPRERNPVPIEQKAGWVPGSVWTGKETVTPTGILSPAVQIVASRCINYAAENKSI